MRTAISTLTACLFLLTMSTAVFAKSSVQGGLPAIENRVTELEDRVDNIENAIVTQEDITALESRVESLENESATKDDVTDLADRVTALEDRVNGMEQSAHPQVVDANGLLLGPLHSGGLNNAGTLMFINGISTHVQVTPTEIRGFDIPLWFGGTECSGNVLIEWSRLYGSTAPGSPVFGVLLVANQGTLYFPHPDTVQIQAALSSREPDQPCVNTNISRPFLEAELVSPSIFDVFTPPFSITGIPSLPSP